MRILIVGAGEVGTSIAEDLVDAHRVVVVDIDPDRVEEITSTMDVLAVEGDGTSLDTLDEAGIEQADIVIAATDDDETNLAVCGTVSATSETFTIAQVAKPTYLRTWRESHGAFGANYLVNSELRAARGIASIIDLPMAHDFEEFGHGAVQVVEFEVTEESPVCGEPVGELGLVDLSIVGVLRGGVVYDPSDTELQANDRLVVVGTPEAVELFSSRLTPEERAEEIEDIIVFGATSTAREVAQTLEEEGRSPRVIAPSTERARELKSKLPQSTILVHDATDPEFLQRENVGDADIAIVAFGSDQQGLLVSMLARRQGVDRTVTVVSKAEYGRLFEAAGVDVAVHPRAEAAEEITRFTRGHRAENVALVEPDVAEVFEVELDEDSSLLGQTLSEAEETLPEKTVIGAVIRDGEYRTVWPNLEFQVDDRVVVFTPTSVDRETITQL